MPTTGPRSTHPLTAPERQRVFHWASQSLPDAEWQRRAAADLGRSLEAIHRMAVALDLIQSGQVPEPFSQAAFDRLAQRDSRLNRYRITRSYLLTVVGEWTTRAGGIPPRTPTLSQAHQRWLLMQAHHLADAMHGGEKHADHADVVLGNLVTEALTGALEGKAMTMNPGRGLTPHAMTPTASWRAFSFEQEALRVHTRDAPVWPTISDAWSRSRQRLWTVLAPVVAAVVASVTRAADLPLAPSAQGEPRAAVLPRLVGLAVESATRPLLADYGLPTQVVEHADFRGISGSTAIECVMSIRQPPSELGKDHLMWPWSRGYHQRGEVAYGVPDRVQQIKEVYTDAVARVAAHADTRAIATWWAEDWTFRVQTIRQLRALTVQDLHPGPCQDVACQAQFAADRT